MRVNGDERRQEETLVPLDGIDFGKGGGLVPVVVFDHQSRTVLMVGYSNREALEKTLESRRLHLWSRSREKLWLKGEKSGNYLLVDSLCVDCDGDTILAEVSPATGTTPICHTGADTCFSNRLI